MVVFCLFNYILKEMRKRQRRFCPMNEAVLQVERPEMQQAIRNAFSKSTLELLSRNDHS